MSKIEVNLKDDILTIRQVRTRMTIFDTKEIDINTLVLNKPYNTDMVVSSKKNDNRLIFVSPFRNSEVMVVAVWTRELRVRYGVCDISKVYHEFFRLRYKLLHVGLGKKYLSVWLIGYFTQLNLDLKVDKVQFYIDDRNNQDSPVRIVPKQLPFIKALSFRNISHYKLPVRGLLTDGTQINTMLNMAVFVDGHRAEYRLGKKSKFISSPRVYYAPYKSCYTDGYAVHLRRTDRGNFAVVKRPMEEIEHKLFFRFMESDFVSFLLYHIGKWRSGKGKKKVNLFYEKFSSKAEEGTFELFQLARDQGTSDCFYIIDENTEDYQRIKNEKNVVRKYSLKYYWLLYRVNHYISTEAPAHLNILRSNNKYFRISTVEHPFIFLQHGITYLKCQGPSSTFVAGKEGEPTYMIVGSEKERDVCSDMLKIYEERFLNTGLPIFGKVSYKHINQDSPDKVVIMLTWKSYEEHIQNFEDSEYYKNVMEIYHMLEKYISKENILIVPHPKMAEHFSGTKMESALWKDPISKVLEVAKLMVTDYSSACYNSFYQGGAVVFYQPDLELYQREAGELIPKDEEYIGYRTYFMSDLENVLSRIIKDGRIILSEGRTKEFEDRYRTINEYSDGRNIERIFQELKKHNIV